MVSLIIEIVTMHPDLLIFWYILRLTKIILLIVNVIANNNKNVYFQNDINKWYFKFYIKKQLCIKFEYKTSFLYSPSARYKNFSPVQKKQSLDILV